MIQSIDFNEFFNCDLCDKNLQKLKHILDHCKVENKLLFEKNGKKILRLLFGDTNKTGWVNQITSSLQLEDELFDLLLPKSLIFQLCLSIINSNELFTIDLSELPDTLIEVINGKNLRKVPGIFIKRYFDPKSENLHNEYNEEYLKSKDSIKIKKCIILNYVEAFLYLMLYNASKAINSYSLADSRNSKWNYLVKKYLIYLFSYENGLYEDISQTRYNLIAKSYEKDGVRKSYGLEADGINISAAYIAFFVELFIVAYKESIEVNPIPWTAFGCIEGFLWEGSLLLKDEYNTLNIPKVYEQLKNLKLGLYNSLRDPLFQFLNSGINSISVRALGQISRILEVYISSWSRTQSKKEEDNINNLSEESLTFIYINFFFYTELVPKLIKKLSKDIFYKNVWADDVLESNSSFYSLKKILKMLGDSSINLMDHFKKSEQIVKNYIENPYSIYDNRMITEISSIGLEERMKELIIFSFSGLGRDIKVCFNLFYDNDSKASMIQKINEHVIDLKSCLKYYEQRQQKKNFDFLKGINSKTREEIYKLQKNRLEILEDIPKLLYSFFKLSNFSQTENYNEYLKKFQLIPLESPHLILDPNDDEEKLNLNLKKLNSGQAILDHDEIMRRKVIKMRYYNSNIFRLKFEPIFNNILNFFVKNKFELIFIYKVIIFCLLKELIGINWLKITISYLKLILLTKLSYHLPFFYFFNRFYHLIQKLFLNPFIGLISNFIFYYYFLNTIINLIGLKISNSHRLNL